MELEGILVDRTLFEEYFISRSHVSQRFKEYSQGLVFILDKNTFVKLSSLPLGKPRFQFSQSKDFKNSIKQSFPVFYSKQKNVCILSQDCIKELNLVLQTLNKYLPNKTILWISTETKKDIETLIRNNFDHPYISEKNPLGESIPVSVCFFSFTEQSVSFTEQSVSFTGQSVSRKQLVTHKTSELKQNKGEDCRLSFVFGKNAIEYLKNVSKVAIDNLNSSKQKELSGQLEITSSRRQMDKIVYIINVVLDSVQSGQEESVNVSPTRYNFHSHPEEAYIRHSVTKAWPSSTDYYGYLQLGHNTIFHCVATLEGLYLISFSKYWGKHLKNIEKSFIVKKYDIDHKESFSPETYVEYINSIDYKGKGPIYNIQFSDWTKIKNRIFNVHYPQIENVCLNTDGVKELYRKVH